MEKIYVYGKDSRSTKLKYLYSLENKIVEKVEEAKLVICPMPLTRDNEYITSEEIKIDELFSKIRGKKLYTGGISKEVELKCIENNIQYIDMLKIEEVTIMNAIPSAEGAIQIAMEMTDFTLHESNCLILGYGNIGKVLARILTGLGANVFCEARSEKDLANIKSMRYNCIRLEELSRNLNKMNVIFNTVPSIILDEKKLRLINKNCTIIDLASKPGGIDLDKAKELNLNTVWALGLPGKVAPYTAAKYLKDTIDKNKEM